ncbi:hypothetical protein DSO57_1026293 [Entomophthora muscae]|uniref:Uncharacterized protein n=1 Tax=Entomophthora muscae TaxID=34485 RepID=A0ACC2SF59_9FUNG|nr:hypothetical protein DSO57_1026293 [Entomophthora muscae]
MFLVQDQANKTQKITSYLGCLESQFDAPNKGMAMQQKGALGKPILVQSQTSWGQRSSGDQRENSGKSKVSPVIPHRDKPEEYAKIAATKKDPPELFAPSQDFEEDPVQELITDDFYTIPTCRKGRPWKITANAVEVVSKPYAAQLQETCLNKNPNVSSNMPNLKEFQLKMSLKTIENNFPEIGQSLKQHF